uniref:Uncharacterized protein n=1 Tax=Curvibacter symbiont subsp. Hydra magnipapillata TaxID=667019 RepID=C9YG78_CURXX|nr:hypothetical protein Csp_B17780 [Curvibacter putative symbiont of Hydra magnipapillata]
MKTSFIFIAILVCSVAGTLTSNRAVKTACSWYAVPVALRDAAVLG